VVSRFFAERACRLSGLTDYLEHERTLTEFLEDFRGVTREDAIATLEEAKISLAAALK
jgi:hypothetical protein